MTDEELIFQLRQEGYDHFGRTSADLAADRIEQLVEERDLMKTAGVIEIASRNNRVTEYMFHWEGRALDAEAKLAKAVEALRKLITCVDDGCYCSEMRMASTMDEACEVLTELEKTE